MKDSKDLLSLHKFKIIQLSALRSLSISDAMVRFISIISFFRSFGSLGTIFCIGEGLDFLATKSLNFLWDMSSFTVLDLASLMKDKGISKTLQSLSSLLCHLYISRDNALSTGFISTVALTETPAKIPPMVNTSLGLWVLDLYCL